jgi:hypothetical protein
MNMAAGKVFDLRNPKTEPIINNIKGKYMVWVMNSPKMDREIIAKPAASPSKPSIRLNEFVTPTINIIARVN